MSLIDVAENSRGNYAKCVYLSACHTHHLQLHQIKVFHQLFLQGGLYFFGRKKNKRNNMSVRPLTVFCFVIVMKVESLEQPLAAAPGSASRIQFSMY